MTQKFRLETFPMPTIEGPVKIPANSVIESVGISGMRVWVPIGKANEDTRKKLLRYLDVDGISEARAAIP